MPTTTWNGATVPSIGDGWKPITHIKTALDTSGLVVGVTSTDQRDGLAALAPNGVLPVPTVVVRKDLAGFPIEVWDGTRWLARQSCHLTANTSQSFPDGQSVAVQFATVARDTGGMANLVADSTKITIQQAGTYSIKGGGGFSTNTATGRVVCWARKNGAEIPYGGQAVPITNQGLLSEFGAKVNVEVDLAAGDYIQLMMQQSTGFAQAFGANPWQTGHLMVTKIT